MCPEVENAYRASRPAESDAAAAERIDRFMVERLAALSRRLPIADDAFDAQLTQELDGLERLDRLRQKHLSRPAPNRRALLFGLLAVTASAITLLVFMRLRSMPVQLEIDCTAVSFRMVRPVQLARFSGLALVQAARFAPVRLEEPASLRVHHLEPPMDLRPGQGGSLSLSLLNIPAQAIVRVQAAADEGSWRVVVEHPAPSSLTLTLAGRLAITTVAVPLPAIDFGRGANLVIQSEAPPSGRLEFDITPLEAKSFLSDDLIQVDRLSFEEYVEQPDDGSVGIRPVRASSVKGGSVFNQGLGGRETTLRPRTTVQTQVVQGAINELRLGPAGLHVAASATVRELKVGVPGALSTLRPSWLEWLRHHHALQMAWGAAAWLLALLIGGIRWWRRFDVA